MRVQWAVPSTNNVRRRRWVAWVIAPFGILVVLVLIAGGAGVWLLGLLGIWAAIFLIAWIVSRLAGGGTHYLESWQFEGDEAVLWRDDRADIYLVPLMARPAIIRPLRLHWARVVVTTRRILVAMTELFTRKQRVVYVLYAGAAPKSEDTGNFGGEFKTGYQALVVQPGVMDVRVGERMQPSPYVALKPDRAVLSSFNCAEFRIYTDLYDSFRLPNFAAQR
jgi:hypothetical protein